MASLSSSVIIYSISSAIYGDLRITGINADFCPVNSALVIGGHRIGGGNPIVVELVNDEVISSIDRG